MHKKKSLQLGERGTAARSLQRTSTDADTVRACDTNYTKPWRGSRLVGGDFTEGSPVHTRGEG